jgi:hypothetical protein
VSSHARHTSALVVAAHETRLILQKNSTGGEPPGLWNDYGERVMGDPAQSLWRWSNEPGASASRLIGSAAGRKPPVFAIAWNNLAMRTAAQAARRRIIVTEIAIPNPINRAAAGSGITVTAPV